ncbi:MAG: response regulator [Chitinispirillaceae bacterium]|nr:response regulator [Chitinispirillaceae bacterium]
MEKSNKVRILVADDEERTSFVIKLSLQIKGYEVECVTDGLSALETITNATAAQRFFHLFICDIQMPRLNGEQLISKLRELDIELPIMAITGYGDKDLVVRLMRIGCQDFLDKPFDGETIIHKVESILARSRKSSEKYEQIKRLSYTGHHARSIAHDLNNILGGVLGYAELALESNKHDTHRSASTKYLQKMCSSVFLASEVCTSLLSHNHSGTTVQPLLKRTSGTAVIEHAVSSMEGIVPETIELQVNTQDVWFHTDQFELQRAILNLVINAVQAMPTGGTLALSLTMAPLPRPDSREIKNCARISVSDTGPGIDENIRHKLFENGLTTKFKGNGIGLSTVKDIALAHNGWVEVSNNIPRGAIFTLCIPLLTE